MEPLHKTTCDACRVDSPQVTDSAATELLTQIPHWEIIEANGIKQLQRTYKFDDFVTALAFTNAVGELAESENHHPSITTEWGAVKVIWWTHKIKGLHVNDFVMAARTDKLMES